MKYKIRILLLITIGFSFSANAQIGDNAKNSIHNSLTFHLIDVESGLSNNYINSIEEENLGRIWIATSDGLNSYDGSMFKQFKTTDNPNFLNNNV